MMGRAHWWMAVGLLGVAACKSQDDPSEQAVPVAPPAPPPKPEPTPEELAAPTLVLVDDFWKVFDGRPKRQKDKAAFGEVISQCERLMAAAPEKAQPIIAIRAMQNARERIESWMSVGSYSTGHESRDLVPHKTPAVCRMWGGQWVDDADTLSNLMNLGFTRVLCGPKIWDLVEEAQVCFLWTEIDDGERAPSAVWDDLASLNQARIIGKRSGDMAVLALMSFISDHGSMIVGETKTTIVENGPDWFKVTGDFGSGFVEPRDCHHSLKKNKK